MADNPNEVLLEAGFDFAKLDVSLKKLAAQIKRTLTASLKDVVSAQSLGLTKEFKVTVSFNKAATKKNWDDLKDSLTQFKVPLSFNFTQAQKDIDAFKQKQTPLQLPVQLVSPAPAPPKDTSFKVTNKLDPASVAINPGAVTQVTGEITQLKETLLGLGYTEKQAAAETKALEAELKKISSTVTSVRNENVALNKSLPPGSSPVGLNDTQIKRLNTANEQLLALQNGIRGVHEQAVKTGPVIQESLGKPAEVAASGFKSMAFSVGLVGYGLENVGRRLIGFSEQLFAGIKHVATVTEQFERLKNALVVEGTPEAERNSIEERIRRISLLPGGKLQAVTESFQELRTAGLDVVQTLDLIQGLTKATTISGKGTQGVAQAVKVLRRALLATDNSFKTQTLDTLEAQVGPQVAAALLKAFNSVDAKTLNKQGGPAVVKAITDELKKLGDALPVTLDTVNHIEDSLLLIGDSILHIINPALEKVLKNFLSLEGVVKGLEKRFDNLSQPQKNFISGLLAAIPATLAGLGAILSLLGVLAVSVAILGKTWKLYDSAILGLGKSAGLVKSEISAVGKETLTLAEGVTKLTLASVLAAKAKSLFGGVGASGLAAGALNAGLKVPGAIRGLNPFKGANNIAGIAGDSLKVGTLVQGPASINFNLPAFTDELSGVTKVALRFKQVFSPVIALFTNFKAAIVALPELLGGVGLGFARIVGFTNPLGIAVNLLLAYATNFGKFRDSVNEGVITLTKSFKNLFDAIVKFGGTSAGGFIVGLFQTLGDVIENVIGLVGTLIDFIFSLFGDVINLVADVLNAFSEDSWRKVLTKTLDAIQTFLLHVIQRILKVLTDLIQRMFNIVGGILIKLKLIDPGTLDDVNKALNNFKDTYLDTNVVIQDGIIIRKKEVEAQEEEIEKANAHTAALKSQAEAYRGLAAAAEASRKASQEASAKSGVDALKGRADVVKKEISEISRQFKEALDNEFNPEKTQEILNTWTAKVRAKNAELLKIQEEIFAKDALEAVRKVANSDLAAKTKQTLISTADAQNLPALKGAAGLLDNIALARTYEQARQLFDSYRKIVSDNINQLEGLGAKILLADLQQVAADMTAAAKEAHDTLTNTKDGLNQDVQKVYDDMQKAEGSRHDLLIKKRENNQLQVDLDTLDGQIKSLQADNAELDLKTANFELTASKARLLRAENDKKIAALERDRDKSRVQKEIDVINQNTPGDVEGIKEKSLQLSQIDRQFDEAIRAIDRKAGADIKESQDKVQKAGLKRLDSAAQDILKVIEPFNKAIVRIFTLGQEDFNLALPVFAKLKEEIRAIAGDVPEIDIFLRDITDAQTSGNVDKLVESFVKLKTNALDTQFTLGLKDLKNSIQAVLFSDVFEPDSGNVVHRDKGNSLFLDALGLGPDVIDTTKADIQTALNKLDFPAIVKLSGLIQNGGLQSKEEIEELLTFLQKAQVINSEIIQTSTDGAVEIRSMFDTAFKAISTDKIDSQLSEVNAKIQQIDTDNQKRAVTADQDTKRQLLVQQAQLNFQKEDLNLQFEARELARQKENAGREAEIFKKLQEDRLAAFLAAEKQILEITGGDASKLPGLKPINLPGTGGASTAPSPTAPGKKQGIFGTLKGNLGDLSATKSLTDRLNKVNQALRDTYKAGSDAKDALLGLFDAMASGEFVVDAFADVIVNGGSVLDAFATLAVSAFFQVGKAIADAIVDVLVNGGNFFESMLKFFGEMLIQLGSQLIQLGIAAVAIGILAKLVPFFSFLDPNGTAIPLGLATTAVGVGLVAAGVALGGGSKAADKTANTNATNSSNTKAGATGPDFDPNKDPKTIYQKALQAQILIDIRTDSSQIIKTVIKSVNGNGRLATLIGNRKLNFGY
jgi:hypothetical protein